MSSPPLPQELINEIVECLENDVPTLRSCALAASCFLEPCQRKLFANLVLELALHPKPEDHDAILERLLEAFTNSAYLATYVQEFTISYLGRYKSSWMKSPALALIIRKLTAVSAFKLDISRWEDLSPAVHSALAELIALPTLRSVSFMDLRFMSSESLTSLFVGMGVLDIFEMTSAFAKLAPTRNAPPPNLRLRTRALLLRNMVDDQLVHFLEKCFDLSLVRSLQVAVRDDVHAERRNQAILWQMTKLQHLRLEFAISYTWLAIGTLLDLSRHVHLWTLDLYLRAAAPADNPSNVHSPLHHAIALLASVASLPALHTVSLHLQLKSNEIPWETYLARLNRVAQTWNTPTLLRIVLRGVPMRSSARSEVHARNVREIKVALAELDATGRLEVVWAPNYSFWP
ncbi:Aldo-keto reductase [Mycena chlorophos]|uniref:Aldo-keto reductase n=1 Tax=Mycena chlorophos TaxID=658473 RepID=A0A8H6WJN8_MYCCL|nr:Aldo-keto reductase [Mycena chlorophos]